VIVIAELPDNIASSLSLAVSASGRVRTKTTPLLTVEEVDKALAKNINDPLNRPSQDDCACDPRRPARLGICVRWASVSAVSPQRMSTRR
jgi:hypothetical protein